MARSSTLDIRTRLNSSELRELAEFEAQPSVSIFMAAYGSPPESQQNAIRLKNLLKRAAAEVRASDEIPSARDLLDELASVGDAADTLLAKPAGGLAVFARAGFCRAYSLATPFEELAVASPWFHITPLLDWAQSNRQFYVLAASQKDVRLLQGDKHELREVEAKALPGSLVEALNIDEYVQSIQFHTSGFGGRASIDVGGGMYHGHAGGDQGDKKVEIAEFFRRLDDALNEYLRHETAPLVFAGVNYLFPIFQASCRYRGLAKEAIPGNPEGWSSDELHGPAWEIVRKEFAAGPREASSQFGALAARDKASNCLESIVPAAHEGRVGTLLVRRGARRVGRVDADTGRVLKDGAEGGVEEDLVNCALSRTIMSSGAAYLLDGAEMPTDEPVAALFRY